MSMYGAWLPATISQGTAITSAIDLGRDYDYLSIQIPSMDECKLSVWIAEKEGGTYLALGQPADTEEETFDRADVWRLGGYRFIKIAATQSQSAERLIRVRGMRY